MLKLSSVTKRFLPASFSFSKNSDLTPPALREVSLEVKRGEFLYVLGGTGAGKTSLLKLCAAMDQEYEGDLDLFGVSLSSASGSSLAQIRRSIGYIPQTPLLIPELSVQDHLLHALDIARPRSRSKQELRNSVESMLRKTHLWDARSQASSELSGGQAQRLALAIALIIEPELIIADEPTGAQDHDMTWSMMNLLFAQHQKGVTILLATHDREIVQRVPKACMILSHGSLSRFDKNAVGRVLA